MTAKATIRDFQMVERADIDMSGLTLIAAQNSRGKSSAIKALAAALTGTTQLGGITKKDAGRLVRAGCATAWATIHVEGGTATASWPKCEFSSEGRPLSINAHAAGLEHIIDMAPKDRAAALAGILRTAPEAADFEAAASAAGLPEAVITKVWADVEALGFDGKLADLKTKATAFKTRWEDVTGEKYGPEKAKSWVPATWTADLADASEDDLTAEAGEARAELESCIAAHAVDKAEEDRLLAACKGIAQLRQSVGVAQTAKDAAGEGLRAAQLERDALPPAEQPATVLCPCCNAQLQIDGQGASAALVKAVVVPEAEIKKRKASITICDGNIKVATKVLDEATAALTAAQNALRDAERAEQQLANLRAKTADGAKASKTISDVNAARDRSDAADKRLKALQAKERADQLHAQITVNLQIQGLLAPDGLRKSKLVKVLDTFNDGLLRDLCEAAGWPSVRVEPDAKGDLQFTSGGRPYAALAGLGPQLSSDQFRARVIVQIAIAQIQNQPLVLIDAADVLDHVGRNGLFTLLKHSGLRGVVCMTFGKPDLVPDLGRAGLGASYWIEDGITYPIADAKAKTKEAA